MGQAESKCQCYRQQGRVATTAGTHFESGRKRQCLRGNIGTQGQCRSFRQGTLNKTMRAHTHAQMLCFRRWLHTSTVKDTPTWTLRALESIGSAYGNAVPTFMDEPTTAHNCGGLCTTRVCVYFLRARNVWRTISCALLSLPSPRMQSFADITSFFVSCSRWL
jgi:hypothetical protein